MHIVKRFRYKVHPDLNQVNWVLSWVSGTKDSWLQINWLKAEHFSRVLLFECQETSTNGNGVASGWYIKFNRLVMPRVKENKRWSCLYKVPNGHSEMC